VILITQLSIFSRFFSQDRASSLTYENAVTVSSYHDVPAPNLDMAVEQSMVFINKALQEIVLAEGSISARGIHCPVDRPS
jgi:hypothetical protein